MKRDRKPEQMQMLGMQGGNLECRSRDQRKKPDRKTGKLLQVHIYILCRKPWTSPNLLNHFFLVITKIYLLINFQWIRRLEVKSPGNILFQVVLVSRDPLDCRDREHFYAPLIIIEQHRCENSIKELYFPAAMTQSRF